MTRLTLFSCFIAALLLSAAADAEVAYVEPARPYKDSAFLKELKPGSVKLGGAPVKVPMITWAADGVTVQANGGVSAKPGSALAKAMGVPAELALVDDFNKQVADYVEGRSPFLRGTIGMINLASEALKSFGADYEPIVILQLSWSTGADGFVAKGIESLADLKGKTIVVQQNGPHVDLVQVLLEDAGLKPNDVTIKYVREITYNPDADDGKAQDPANALREDSSLAGAACIFPDMLALTAGGAVGTGAEDSVKGARPILTTRTASRVIADVYAVRADFLKAHREVVHGFVLANLAEQEKFRAEIANVSKKAQADKAKLAAFRQACEPLSGIFLQDEGAVADYISWIGLDLQLAGYDGNVDFFTNSKNPVGFASSCSRIQDYYANTGIVAAHSAPAHAEWDYVAQFASILGGGAETPMEAKPVFATTQAVRRAAESEDASLLFTSVFQFPANTSEFDYKNHMDVFSTLHEKVTRYGGAVVQLRGHSDNYFYNFVQTKFKQGATTYKRRVPGTNTFKELPLPKVEQVINSANQLSYERAFSVKRAYAQFLREVHGYTGDEIDLSRFDVKGMGVSDPLKEKPTTPEERAENMRGEMYIYAVEAEIPLDFGMDDLQ